MTVKIGLLSLIFLVKGTEKRAKSATTTRHRSLVQALGEAQLNQPSKPRTTHDSFLVHDAYAVRQASCGDLQANLSKGEVTLQTLEKLCGKISSPECLAGGTPASLTHHALSLDAEKKLFSRHAEDGKDHDKAIQLYRSSHTLASL